MRRTAGQGCRSVFTNLGRASAQVPETNRALAPRNLVPSPSQRLVETSVLIGPYPQQDRRLARALWRCKKNPRIFQISLNITPPAFTVVLGSGRMGQAIGQAKGECSYKQKSTCTHKELKGQDGGVSTAATTTVPTNNLHPLAEVNSLKSPGCNQAFTNSAKHLCLSLTRLPNNRRPMGDSSNEAFNKSLRKVIYSPLERERKNGRRQTA